jgi:hypothetical protein
MSIAVAAQETRMIVADQERSKLTKLNLGFFVLMMLLFVPLIWSLEMAPARALFPNAPYVWWVKFALVLPWLSLGESGYKVSRAAQRGELKPAVANSLLFSFLLTLLFIYLLLVFVQHGH